MFAKRFVPCIYLYQEHAVKGTDDLEIIETDPVRLASKYNENGADEIIVYDMSEGDEEHEKSLDLMKEIASISEVNVVGCGNIKRMEDVKKILYTGCCAAILDYDKPSNIELTEEVSQKFGKDKIRAAFSNPEVLTTYKSTIDTYVEELVLMDIHKAKDCAGLTELPIMVSTRGLALNKLLELLSNEFVCGVTGNVINANYQEIQNLKDLCRANNLAVEELDSKISWDQLKKNSDGMVPVVVQDYRTLEVLMVAYMNQEAYEATLKTGKMTYYSRSRQELWLKGATSGHFQYVKSLTADCDLDTILAKVSQVGAACHTGARSCFFNEISKKDVASVDNPLTVFEDVMNVIADRKIHPKEGSYTNYLFDKGIDKILKKLGEEATEIVIAAKNPNANEVKYEISDFLYHMMVLMVEKGVTWEEITTELANR